MSIRSEVKKLKKLRLSRSNRFLWIVIGIYAVLGFYDIILVKDALIKTFEVFVKIIPVLVFVFFVIYIINRYLDARKIQKHVGEESGLKGWMYAVLAGAVLAGPPYVLYPIFGDLQSKGMKNSLIAVVLYNRNVKIQFLPAMIYYFGWGFSIVVSIYMIVFSLFNGMLIKLLARNKYN